VNKSTNNETALFIACLKGYKEIVKVLLDYKADINHQDSSGKTALDIAQNGGHKEIVEMLLNSKRDMK
jgi:ankyrin repeat protein